MKNYYKILELSENASDKDIHQAYRKLAKKYHPDLNEGQDKSFKDLVEAYETLKDYKKKELYDRKLAEKGLSENKTIIELIFNGYLLSMSAGVLFFYGFLIFLTGAIFKDSYLIFLFSFSLFAVGLYLKYRSSAR